MEAGFASVALVFTGFLVLLTGLWAWGVVAVKAALTWRLIPEAVAGGLGRYLNSHGLSSQLPLVAWSPRRSVPWAFLDLFLLTGLYIVFGAALHESGFIADGKMETLTLQQKEKVIIANLLLSVGVAVVSVAVTVVRCGANGGDLGWSVRYVGSDLRLGAIAFVMLAPPVYALQGLLVHFWKKSEHPIAEMFKDAPNAGFFGMLFLSAAVVAPLFEELVFRVLMQGFLEKVVEFRGNPMELLVGKTNLIPIEPAAKLPTPPIVDDNPYSPPQELSIPLPEGATVAILEQPELRGVSAWVPIVVCSAVFALLHYSHGPDWVPLLFLAMGLGYLYQRTHRLLPSVTVHALLNSLSMWGLWVQVHQPGVPSP